MSETTNFHGDDHSWIQTATGRQFWPLDPHPEDVCIEDIAHALAMKCRYTGHCRLFYSVGQHSLYVARVIEDAIRQCREPSPFDKRVIIAGLMHDAAEAYTADVARPIKKHLTEFAVIEERLEKVIAERFNLLYPFPPVVKEADNAMLLTERITLMPNPPRPWKTYGAKPMPWGISTMTIAEVRYEFLRKFRELRE